MPLVIGQYPRCSKYPFIRGRQRVFALNSDYAAGLCSESPTCIWRKKPTKPTTKRRIERPRAAAAATMTVQPTYYGYSAAFPLQYALCSTLLQDFVFLCSCGWPRTMLNIVHRTLESPMPIPILGGNAFSALSKESLYDSPLDLGFSVEALAAAPGPRARRYCISSAGIGCSGVDAQAKYASAKTHLWLIWLTAAHLAHKPNKPNKSR